MTLRWALQRGDIVFPKSSNPDRMRQNFAVFDVESSADDVATVDALDRVTTVAAAHTRTS